MWKSNFWTPNRAAQVLVLGVSGLLIWRLFHLINRYTVNLPVWDQFDFYFLLAAKTDHWYNFDKPLTLWQLFDLQFGPHRLGVGLVVSKYIARLTHWNIRAEAFLIGMLLSLATLTALLVKRRLFGTITWTDCAIPLFMLTAAQHEIWTSTVQTFHGGFPPFFIMLYCLAWTWRPALRYPTVLIVNFLATFTGYAFFLGAVTILLFGVRFVRALLARQRTEILTSSGLLAVAFASLGIFFMHYGFNTGDPNFHFPDPHWPLYPNCMAIAFARACGFIGKSHKGVLIARTIGWLLLAAAIAAFFKHLARSARSGQSSSAQSIVITSLVSYSLCFSANMAVGRISMGAVMIQSSRYVPLMVPGLIGLYFAALALRDRNQRRIAVVAMVLLAAFSGVFVKADDLRGMQLASGAKIAWVESVLQNNNLDLAAAAAAKVNPLFTVYPSPHSTHLQGKVNYLRQNHLSFFYTNQPQ